MKQEFTVTVKSPYGKQPLEQFHKHLLDMSEESETRWGIQLEVTKVEDTE